MRRIGGGRSVPAFDAPALPAIPAGMDRSMGRPQLPSGARPGDKFQSAFNTGQLGLESARLGGMPAASEPLVEHAWQGRRKRDIHQDSQGGQGGAPAQVMPDGPRRPPAPQASRIHRQACCAPHDGAAHPAGGGFRGGGPHRRTGRRLARRRYPNFFPRPCGTAAAAPTTTWTALATALEPQI